MVKRNVFVICTVSLIMWKKNKVDPYLELPNGIKI